MATQSYMTHTSALACKKLYRNKIVASVQPTPSTIKVVINGISKDIGRAAVLAVTRARGMELAGAIDSQLVGEDAGQVLYY
jgi:chloroplast NAD(P)H dehydrogenase